MRKQALGVSRDIWVSIAGASIMAAAVAFAGSTVSNVVASAAPGEAVRIRVSEAAAPISLICALQPGATRCRDTDLFPDSP